MISKIGNFTNQARRVLLVSTKPDRHEFRQSVKITGMGMALLGVVGFAVFLLAQLVGGL
ncbi:MAG: protein translocase SEC61 complex subunit gamma [Candidatus Aenigmarchaeota archaeon]|nr:protein translocase SEC61 complex subunit gamma [Candidatus Aenigmarchaeota archaeon]